MNFCKLILSLWIYLSVCSLCVCLSLRNLVPREKFGFYYMNLRAPHPVYMFLPYVVNVDVCVYVCVCVKVSYQPSTPHPSTFRINIPRNVFKILVPLVLVVMFDVVSSTCMKLFSSSYIFVAKNTHFFNSWKHLLEITLQLFLSIYFLFCTFSQKQNFLLTTYWY